MSAETSYRESLFAFAREWAKNHGHDVSLGLDHPGDALQVFARRAADDAPILREVRLGEADYRSTVQRVVATIADVAKARQELPDPSWMLLP